MDAPPRPTNIDYPPVIPQVLVPKVCIVCHKWILVPNDGILTWFPRCKSCPDPWLTYSASRIVQKARETEDETTAVYHVTFTSREYLSKEAWMHRIARLLKNKTYPIIDYYGCFEETEQGRLHMHFAFKHKLLKDSRGKNRYPYENYYKAANAGEMITKQKVADSENLENVFNYINKEGNDKIGKYFDF